MVIPTTNVNIVNDQQGTNTNQTTIITSKNNTKCAGYCTLIDTIQAQLYVTHLVLGLFGFDWSKMFLFSRKSIRRQWMIKSKMNYED